MSPRHLRRRIFSICRMLPALYRRLSPPSTHQCGAVTRFNEVTSALVEHGQVVRDLVARC